MELMFSGVFRIGRSSLLHGERRLWNRAWLALGALAVLLVVIKMLLIAHHHRQVAGLLTREAAEDRMSKRLANLRWQPKADVARSLADVGSPLVDLAQDDWRRYETSKLHHPESRYIYRLYFRDGRLHGFSWLFRPPPRVD